MADASKVIDRLTQMLAATQRELAIALTEAEELREAQMRDAMAKLDAEEAKDG